MKIISLLKLTVLGLLTCTLFACGSGEPFFNSGFVGIGGSSGKIVSGIATAGILYPGTVKVYGISSDGTQTLLNTPSGTATQPGGLYSVNIGTWGGPVVIKAYGTFTDEATGHVIVLPEAQALQAALPSGAAASGVVNVPVTPFTDLAVKKAGPLNDANINAANQGISTLFGFNVINTMPVEPSDAALAGASAAQRQYTAQVAAISQYVANINPNPTATDLQNALAQIASGITLGATPHVTGQLGVDLQTAANGVSTNANIPPTLRVIAAGPALDPMKALGNKSVTYKLRTAGEFAGTVFGVQVKLGLPPNMTMSANANGSTAAGVVVLSGNSVSLPLPASKNDLETFYTPAAGESNAGVTIGMIHSTGFTSGEFATITCIIAANVETPPLASTITVTVTKISDSIGGNISGSTVQVF